MITAGLKPDEIVFNSLITGCAKLGRAQLGKQLLADMIASGVRPSNVTFSILVRMCHQSKNLDDAVMLLKTGKEKYNVNIEPRLYLQLLQCCVRERQGRRAIEAYELMCERTLPTQAANSGTLSICCKLQMFDTALEILQMAIARGSSVNAADTKLILE